MTRVLIIFTVTVLLLINHEGVKAQNTTTTPVLLPAAPIAPVSLQSIFYIEKDSADNARYMAMTACVVSTLCGFAPNGLLASRSALLLAQCVEAPPDVNTPMQLPFVVTLGESGPWAYYFGAAVINPVFFVAISFCSGMLGLVFASARGVTRRRGLSMLHYPSHLLIPLMILLPQSMFSASVAVTRAGDGLLVALAGSAAVIWLLAIAVMCGLLMIRFRAVYVRRMETIDESGNITTRATKNSRRPRRDCRRSAWRCNR